tara:strand:+ start:42 stop:518 length:477 start_codon:yes stop_codon:yes gene_type:complete
MISPIDAPTFKCHYFVMNSVSLKPHPNALICKEPSKYRRVVESLKEGKGVIEIAVEQGLSKTTVQSIRERNKDILPSWKRRTAKALGDAGVALAESIAHGHENIPWAQKALSLGILLTKKAELEGQLPEIKVMHQHSITHEGLIKRFSELGSLSRSSG